MKKNLKEHIEVDNREEQDFIFHSIGDYFTSISVELPLNEELEKIVARVMSNQDETRKLSDQLMSKKLLEFYKSKLSLKKKKLSFDAFVKQAYGQG